MHTTADDRRSRHGLPGSRPVRRLLLGVPLTALAFVCYVDTARSTEAWLTARLLGDRVDRVRPATLFVPAHAASQPFAVEVTRSCSSFSVALGASLIAFAFLRSGLRRRAIAVLTAVAVAVAVNVGRVAGLVLVGIDRGVPSLVALHDWLGTIVTIGGAAMSLVVVLWLGTGSAAPAVHSPSTSDRPRARR